MSERYIAAIGGSAGLLEPLKIFFDHTPNDQVSYVILRHLPADYKSLLKEILTRHSKLEIVEVEDGTVMNSNKVYLPPSGKHMIIEKDVFHFVDRPVNGPNRAIDIFLQSLAGSYGTHAIVVILSGAGSDGTNGVQFVKDAGGMIIAQEPSSCEFPSMPLNTIQKGNVDFTALPKDMPHLIQEYVEKERNKNSLNIK